MSCAEWLAMPHVARWRQRLLRKNYDRR